jgi:hypothetical protein
LAGDGHKGIVAAGKVIPMPQVRKASLSLTLLEFAHTLVLMLWVGSLAGFALVVVPVLFSSLPSRELASKTVLAILERSAFLGCGAGAFLLLTTLLMHVTSLRQTRATLVQMVLLLVMTGTAVVSQLTLTPRINTLLGGLAAPLESLSQGDPARGEFARLHSIAIAVLLVQVAAGVGVLLFAVRRWYRYLPLRRETESPEGTVIGPRLR